MSSKDQRKTERFKVMNDDAGKRADVFLKSKLPEMSRQYLQNLFEEGLIYVNGKPCKSGYKVKECDNFILSVPPLKELKLKPVDMDLDVIYEDANVIAVNKKAGMVVHCGQDGTHMDDSLVNGLLLHCKGQLSGINGVMRPGIVHRLDKDTSGVMIVAKNDSAHRFLSEQFHDRKVEKKYIALVCGKLMPKVGTIDAPVGRDSADRKKMGVTSEHKGKMAISKYEVVKYLGDFTLVEVRILTGRTHQIRVHFSSIGYPLVGDVIYGNKGVNAEFEKKFGLKRVFLHAERLSIMIPGKTLKSAKKMVFEAKMPENLKKVLNDFNN
jgi:23S rRNA pseudouridine1911/1915/1917 synthase